MIAGTIAISWGRRGGWYATSGRVCFGRLAITYLPVEIDDVMIDAYGDSEWFNPKTENTQRKLIDALQHIRSTYAVATPAHDIADCALAQVTEELA